MLAPYPPGLYPWSANGSPCTVMKLPGIGNWHWPANRSIQSLLWSNAMIVHTTEVTPLPDYRLRLAFNTGERGEVDLSFELEGEVFAPLRDPILFATARQDPVMRTVVWDNGTDLAPEFLLDLLHQQRTQIAA